MNINDSHAIVGGDHDMEKELKAFDKSKVGIKGLVDAGIDSVPKIFIRPPDEILENYTHNASLQVPVIDLKGLALEDDRERIVKEITIATQKWGIFQVINHGIPQDVLDKTLKDVCRFHEQDFELKKDLYTRDSKQVVYTGEYELDKTRAVDWRDSLTVNKTHMDHFDPDLIPPICRDAILEHTIHVLQLGKVILELLSLALGLKPEFLYDLECDKGWVCRYHYYPACPQPELALGIRHHTDSSFLTILLQDHLGGLQVLYENQWVDVHPIPGSLIVNIGDLFQMMSNDKFKSACHRVIAHRVGPRISAAFFLTGLITSPKIYAPIKELLSKENPPIYREFTIREYVTDFFSRPIEELGYKHFMIKYNEEIN